MRIEAIELFNMYYEIIKKDYPDLSYEELKEICYNPWKFLKYTMECGSLDRIRMKYFGVFYVPPGRARRLLEEAKYRFSKQYITPKQFFKIQTEIQEYLKRIEDEKDEKDAE